MNGLFWRENLEKRTVSLALTPAAVLDLETGKVGVVLLLLDEGHLRNQSSIHQNLTYGGGLKTPERLRTLYGTES